MEKGICLLNEEARPGPAVEFYSYATGELEQITVLPEKARGSIAVSQDGQSLLYTKREYVSSDIMLVENFQ
jgi:hypothetical protein